MVFEVRYVPPFHMTNFWCAGLLSSIGIYSALQLHPMNKREMTEQEHFTGDADQRNGNCSSCGTGHLTTSVVLAERHVRTMVREQFR